MSVRGALFAGLVIAAPVGAQTIAPGMTKSEVIQQFGPPASERHFGAHDYLLFDAGCSRKCGGDDLVILDHNAVVDAVVRTPGRSYSAAGAAPTTLTSVASHRQQPAAIVPATAADSAHRGGMVFEGPRPPATPARYQVIVPHHDSSGGSAPHQAGGSEPHQ